MEERRDLAVFIPVLGQKLSNVIVCIIKVKGDREGGCGQEGETDINLQCRKPFI